MLKATSWWAATQIANTRKKLFFGRSLVSKSQELSEAKMTCAMFSTRKLFPWNILLRTSNFSSLKSSRVVSRFVSFRFWVSPFWDPFLPVLRRPGSTGSGASNAGGASLESRIARLERNVKAHGFRVALCRVASCRLRIISLLSHTVPYSTVKSSKFWCVWYYHLILSWLSFQYTQSKSLHSIHCRKI